MNTTVTLDRAGRIVIPKPLRDELRLEPGDSLHLDSEGTTVTLRFSSSYLQPRASRKNAVYGSP